MTNGDSGDGQAPVLVCVRDGILELVLNRPGKLNAINAAMVDIITAQAQRFAVEPGLRVMLIRATGKFFSAGADLFGELMPGPAIESGPAFRQWYRAGHGSLHPLLDLFEVIEKPIVVAHHATCLGGALEMSLSCDFRLAAQSASYGLPEIALGNIPGSGGVSRLTRLVGPHWARWLVMAGMRVDAAKAEAIGLVHQVFPDAEFDEAVWAFCSHLAQQPGEVMGAAKLAIELAADLERAQARNVERLTASSVHFGREASGLLAQVRARTSGKSG